MGTVATQIKEGTGIDHGIRSVSDFQMVQIYQPAPMELPEQWFRQPESWPMTRLGGCVADFRKSESVESFFVQSVTARNSSGQLKL